MSTIKTVHGSEKEPDFRLYHTPWKITNLAKDLLLINGIVNFWIKPYELAVKKTPTIDWDLIEPKIIEAINKRGKKKLSRYNN
jgi:hypothetical protein